MLEQNFSLEATLAETADHEKNMYFARCDVTQQSMNYPACLWRQKVIGLAKSDDGFKYPQDWSACADAHDCDKCPALNMRKEEELAGKGLYFYPRSKEAEVRKKAYADEQERLKLYRRTATQDVQRANLQLRSSSPSAPTNYSPPKRPVVAAAPAPKKSNDMFGAINSGTNTSGLLSSIISEEAGGSKEYFSPEVQKTEEKIEEAKEEVATFSMPAFEAGESPLNYAKRVAELKREFIEANA